MSSQNETEQQISLAKRLFDNSREGIIITDENTQIVQVNPAFSRITGYSADELVGKTPRIFKSGRTDPSYYQKMWESIDREGYWQGELWDRRKNGELFAVHISITAVTNEQEEIINYMGIISDVTEKKRYLQRIYDLAYYDSLTLMPNRTLFEDRCDHSIKKAKREGNLLALLFVDIDRFKEINNSFGYTTGDELLKKVSVRLKNNMREVDTISHFSGDKFVILIENVDESGAVTPIAEKLLRIFTQPFHLEEQELFITVGIGISIYPYDGESVQTLMRNAETAVYKAKETGKSRYQYYSSELNSRSFERLLLENNLRLAQERDELFLMYQPQICTRDNRIDGVEVLVRWKHSELGLVSPGKFIPVAESTGLIIPIGNWILKTACIQYVHWLEQDIAPPTLAVNLSPAQFNQEGLIDTITGIFQETGFPPERLELELTETTIMSNVESSITILKAFRDLGITIAVDDFGTGYSSLSYLRRLPIKTLKVDRSFISDVESNTDDATIVSAILSLARDLKLQVVAEGVETKEQLEFLRRKNCTYIQGYYFSPPLTDEELQPFLQKRVIEASEES